MFMTPALRTIRAMTVVATPIADAKRAPLRLAPRTIARIDIGAERRRSNVFVLRSIGMETGSIEEALKRRVTARRPGIRVPAAASLPTANARNMTNGKSRLDTRMEGLM